MENLEKENKYFRAKERVGAIKKFYMSLISYFVFIGFLVALVLSPFFVSAAENPDRYLIKSSNSFE